MSDNRIFIKKDHEKDIQAYIDYCRIVGVDDGGQMMSDKEFEAYKKKVAESRKNHLYVYWVNLKGNDCKAIGPESMCFCGHRFKNHNFDNVKTKKVDCKETKCKCKLYEYIPVHGSNDVKCLCKHSFRDHDNLTRKCVKLNCKCNGFSSKMTCNCTYPFDDHSTIIETREERQLRGKNVDPGWMSNNLTAGIGGLNSFTSMVGDIYEMEYQKLMNDPNDIAMIADNFQKKMQIGNNEIGLNTNISNKSEFSILELYNKPNKWQTGSCNQIIKKSLISSSKNMINQYDNDYDNQYEDFEDDNIKYINKKSNSKYIGK